MHGRLLVSLWSKSFFLEVVYSLMTITLFNYRHCYRFLIGFACYIFSFGMTLMILQRFTMVANKWTSKLLCTRYSLHTFHCRNDIHFRWLHQLEIFRLSNDNFPEHKKEAKNQWGFGFVVFSHRTLARAKSHSVKPSWSEI